LKPNRNERAVPPAAPAYHEDGFVARIAARTIPERWAVGDRSGDDEECVMTICRAVPALAVAIFAAIAPAAAQDFYKGKTVTIVVGFTPGGGFDLNARLLARHMGRHLAGNPDVIVQNMPGAASLKSVLYLDTAAPRDGTVISTFNFGQIGDSRMMPEKVKVDFRKFSWIGSISQDLTICYTWHALGVKTLAQLQRHGTVHMGSTGVGTSSDINQKILKEIFKVPVQQVAGYPGSAEERLAIERHELEGDCGAWSSIPQEWVEGAKINPILRSGPIVPPDLPPDVPYGVDIAPSERERDIIAMLTASGQVGRPFIASAMAPAERIALLRAAFDATVKDPEFIADAAKIRMPVTPKSGPEALRTVEAIYATPDDIVLAARKIAGE
jgi:tripartite-type tricarboxylate transporter receptor subunit TctC